MKVRILCACKILGIQVPPDAVPDVPDLLASELVALGSADACQDAVDHAETLGIAVPAELLEALAAAPIMAEEPSQS